MSLEYKRLINRKNSLFKKSGGVVTDEMKDVIKQLRQTPSVELNETVLMTEPFPMKFGYQLGNRGLHHRSPARTYVSSGRPLITKIARSSSQR